MHTPMNHRKVSSSRPRGSTRAVSTICFLFCILVLVGWFQSTRSILNRLSIQDTSQPQQQQQPQQKQQSSSGRLRPSIKDPDNTNKSTLLILLENSAQQVNHSAILTLLTNNNQASENSKQEVFPINKYTGLPGTKGFQFKKQQSLLPPKLPPIEKTSTETVAYIITITDCSWFVRDTVAVLGQSIDDVQGQSRYPHVRVALVHTSAANECERDLSRLGYQVLVRDLPFNTTDIRTPIFRKRIEEDSCCGSREYMKLWIYAMTEYKLVVHLDMDMILLQPLDSLWDAMLDSKKGRYLQTEPSSLYQPLGSGDGTSEEIALMFTRDYYHGSTMTDPNATDRHVVTSKYGVQGGFLVVRPSMDMFQRLIEKVLSAHYTVSKGWNRDGYGGYPGGAQIPGLLSFMYRPNQPTASFPGMAVELNRCLYNNMQDPMYVPLANPNWKLCTTLDKQCSNDCQATPLEKIKIAHFSKCPKPWNCEKYDEVGLPLCSSLYLKWFQTRFYMETNWNMTIPKGDKSSWFYAASLGYCRKLERKKEKRDTTGKTYKVNKGSYRRMVFPWEPQSRVFKQVRL